MLHSALHDFERRLLAATGGFKYLNGAIACTHVDAWDQARKNTIKDPQLKKMFKHIAVARHSLFHRVARSVSVGDALGAMGVVLHRLTGIKDAIPTTEGHDTHPDDWMWPTQLPGAADATATVTAVVTLAVTGQRMSIPKGRERCLVGRTADIERVVVATVSAIASRVLIYGDPGVGKDVVATEAVLDDRIKHNQQLTVQAWLRAAPTKCFGGSWSSCLRRSTPK